MSIGFSPKLPLQYNNADGPYLLNKTYEEVIKQNIKMILLTTQGSRCMDPEFGVGLRQLLFEQDEQHTQGDILARINKQISKYMPFIALQDVNIITASDHQIQLVLKYKIIPLDLSQIFSVDLISTTNN